MTIVNFCLDSRVDGIHPGAKRIWILKRTNYCNSVQTYLVPSNFWHTQSVKNAMVIDVIYLSTGDIHGSTLSSCKTYFEGTGACRKDKGSAFSPKNPALGCCFLGLSDLGFFPPCVALIGTNKQESRIGFCWFFPPPFRI